MSTAGNKSAGHRLGMDPLSSLNELTEWQTSTTLLDILNDDAILQVRFK